MCYLSHNSKRFAREKFACKAYRIALYIVNASAKGRIMAKAKISDKIKTAIRATYAGCVCCGQWDSRDCGHVIAESRGGSLDLSNLRLMCSFCNTAAGNANLEFAQYATPNDGARAVVETNRAAWVDYANAAKRYWEAQDRVSKGIVPNNPYRKPKPYAAPL
jgi:hypothetical protein